MPKTKKRVVMSRLVKLEDADDSFDIEFWQRQGPAAIFSAAWDLVIEYYRHRGLDVSQLRLQRSIENFGKI